MRYTISRGSAHSSLSLDVGVAATPIPHSNAISLYTTFSKSISAVCLKNKSQLSQTNLPKIMLWSVDAQCDKRTTIELC